MRGRFPYPFVFVLLGLPALSGCDAAPTKPAKDQPSATVDVKAVVSVGMTVADMDRSVDFYSRVLSFEKVSDVEVAGTEYERLTGVFGVRLRVVRMRLGEESLDLTEYLAPRGRPVPPDTRSNDRWFQHVAIIVRDMDEAYRHLRKHKVEHASTGPSGCPTGTSRRAASGRSTSRIRMATTSRCCSSPRARGTPAGTRRRTGSFWASTTRPSWSGTPGPAWPSTGTAWG